MSRAGMPASEVAVAQLQPHAGMTHQIADVSCFHTVLCHDPKLPADACVAHGSRPRLARCATGSFQERISGRRDADSEQNFNRRVEHVFLERVNNLMLDIHPVLGHQSSPRLNLGSGKCPLVAVPFFSRSGSMYANAVLTGTYLPSIIY